MADGFIVRKGGVTTEQALAPTITEVSTSNSTIVFTLKNNDTESAVILYETNDEVPDENSIELAGGATSGNLTISGLSVSPAILYASANVVGKVKSNITERSFTFTIPVYTAATGGTTLEYDSGGKRFKSHTFTSSGTFAVSTVGDNIDDRNKVDYLIIAGGGGGGGNGGGGGGAGGYRTTNGTSGGPNPTTESKVIVSTTSFGITVGLGGAKAAFPVSATNGTNSSISFPTTITSIGGGLGAFRDITDVPGGNGGSGGGGASGIASNSSNIIGGNGTAGQGFGGGNGVGGLAGSSAGGGGGGAGSAGTNGSSKQGGNGGNGLANLLRTGSNETRAGGGRGTVVSVGTNGSDGTGFGVNTGSGGVPSGGGASPTDGSDGIVIIRYEIAPSV